MGDLLSVLKTRSHVTAAVADPEDEEFDGFTDENEDWEDDEWGDEEWEDEEDWEEDWDEDDDWDEEEWD